MEDGKWVLPIKGWVFVVRIWEMSFSLEEEGVTRGGGVGGGRWVGGFDGCGVEGVGTWKP